MLLACGGVELTSVRIAGGLKHVAITKDGGESDSSLLRREQGRDVRQALGKQTPQSRGNLHQSVIAE